MKHDDTKARSENVYLPLLFDDLRLALYSVRSHNPQGHVHGFPYSLCALCVFVVKNR